MLTTIRYSAYIRNGSIAVMLGAASLLGQSATARDNPSTCDNRSCTIVRVDDVSRDSPTYGMAGGQPCNADTCTFTNVTVSDGKSTYRLTCNRENNDCTAPSLGAEYQLIAIPGDKPDSLDDSEGEYPHSGKAVFLQTATAVTGSYWLVAQMPIMQRGMFPKQITECTTTDQELNDNDCAKWLARRARIREAACPDTEAAVACQSFQGLLAAGDPDLMDVFARIEHVFVCFRPQEDVFFQLWFSEPNERNWTNAEADVQKAWGLRSETLIQITAPAVDYYNKGIKDENAAIREIGLWSYFPSSSDITPSALARLATSNDAEFKGKTIQIDTSHFMASENYKNTVGDKIKHTLVVQRSTGRFAETYDEEPSGRTVRTYSGHCLVVPNATD